MFRPRGKKRGDPRDEDDDMKYYNGSLFRPILNNPTLEYIIEH